MIDFGEAKFLPPAESYVEFRLYAQQLCPDLFVVTVGYGESAPGYIATDRAFSESDINLDLWRWVPPGCEQRLRAAMEAVLAPKRKDNAKGFQHETNQSRVLFAGNSAGLRARLDSDFLRSR